MPELQIMGLLTRLRRKAPLFLGIPVLFVGVLVLFAVPARSLAQDVPASLRACTAQSDPGRRLACYDREMARLSPSSVPRPAATAPVAADLATSTAPAQPARAMNPQPTLSTPATTPPLPKAASTETATPHGTSSWKKIFSGGATSHLTAHVVRLDRSPDAMVLHLDNGQVWRQVGRASGDLSLHASDSVTIEQHLGSYWLSSRYVSNMQVRQEPQ